MTWRAASARWPYPEEAKDVLVIAGENIEHFSAINAVTAVYRIARALTSRAGRLRRKEASFITADPRFVKLVELVEARAYTRPPLSST
jgi:hypothetical protein